MSERTDTEPPVLEGEGDAFQSPDTMAQHITPIRTDTEEREHRSPLMLPLTPTLPTDDSPTQRPQMGQNMMGNPPDRMSMLGNPPDRMSNTAHGMQNVPARGIPDMNQPPMNSVGLPGFGSFCPQYAHPSFTQSYSYYQPSPIYPEPSIPRIYPVPTPTFGQVQPGQVYPGQVHPNTYPSLSQSHVDHLSVINPAEQSSTSTTTVYKPVSRLPPSFDGSNYNSWRKSLYIWHSVCKVHHSQVASMIFESCTGLARTVLDSLPTSILTDTRPDPYQPDQTIALAAILRLLHDNFATFHYDQPHIAFQELFSYKRSPGVNWQTYIAEFQSKAREVMKAGQKVEGPFLSYLFLENGNLSESDKKLIFSNLEAKGIPFHLATLEQLIHSVRVICMQTTPTSSGYVANGNEEAYLSQQARKKFYRPDSRGFRNDDTASRFQNDTTTRFDDNRRNDGYQSRQGNFQSNYQGNSQANYRQGNHRYGNFGNANSYERQRNDSYGPRNDNGTRRDFSNDRRDGRDFRNDNYRGNQTQGFRGKGNFRSQSPNRNRKGGKSQGKGGFNQQRYSQNFQQRGSSNFPRGNNGNDFQRRDNRYPNTGKGHRKGGNRYERNYRSDHEDTECQQCCTCGNREETRGNSPHPSRDQEVLFNTTYEFSEASECAFDEFDNDIYHAKTLKTLLVDSTPISETIDATDHAWNDAASELTDMDIDDFDEGTQNMESHCHDVFGVTGIHVVINKPVRLHSLDDEELNPLQKPQIEDKRKAILHATTGDYAYPTDNAIREQKETLLDHYVYRTEKGMRRKYIAKGTTHEIGNIKDSPQGIIDTGCTCTIANETFLSKYEAFLKKIGEPRPVIKKKSDTKFRFANGSYGKALMYVEVPVVIGNHEFYMGMHILPCESADLLISLPSLSRMGIKIDFETKAMNIPKYGIQNFQLPMIGNHLYFPIYWYRNFTNLALRSPQQREYDSVINEAAEVLATAKKGLDDIDKFCLNEILPEALKAEIDITDPAFIMKIHRQYAHRSAEKLYKMLYFAKNKDLPKKLTLNYIKEVLNKCPVCSQSKKVHQPKFGGLAAKQFNELIAIDLTEMTYRNGKTLLVAHIIDIHSRLSHAEIIPSKEGIHVVDFLMGWMQRAGRAPKHLFSDRGTEFCNEMLEQFCTTNGTQFHTTQGYHPQSNGIAERRHATLKKKLKFVIEDMNLENARYTFSPRYMLNMVLFSVNSQVLDCGYSPFQIAFGIAPVPWMLQSDSGPPSTWIDNVHDYHPLIADRMILQMKISASAYSHMLNSQLARAWKSRVYKKDKYRVGEHVFYWKRDLRYPKRGYWFGPLTVLSDHGKTYSLEYGNKTYRINAHECYSKEQLFPSDYLHLFTYETNEPSQPEKSEPEIADTPENIKRLFDDSLNEEFDRLIGREDENGEVWIEEQHPLASPIMPDTSISDHSQSSQSSRNLAEDDTVIVKEDPARGRVSRKTNVETDMSQSQPSTPNVQTTKNHTPPRPRSSGSERRPNPLLSPFSERTSRKLIFGLPDDYQSPPRSIFDRSKVRFDPAPEVLEYTPGTPAADAYMVIDRMKLRCANSLDTDIQLVWNLKDNDLLRRLTHLVDGASTAQMQKCLQVVESEKHDLELRLGNDWKLLEHADHWYKDMVEELVYHTEDDTGISAYRNPTKEELKKYQQEFNDSKLKELKSWIENGVFEVVPNYEYREGDNLMTSKWLQNVKTFKDGSIAKFKSRLVIRGFQDQQLEILRKDSPTAAKTSIRLLLNYALEHNYDIHCGDVSTAFLQGENYRDDEQRNIYLRPPRNTNPLIGADENSVWHLNKAAYGLVDAPRKFYDGFMKTLVRAGMKRSLTDFGLFYYRNGNKTSGIVVTHVDDILYAGSDEFLNTIIDDVKHKYKFGKIKTNHFDYCGSTITYVKTRKTISISQSHYATKVSCPKLDAKYPPEDPLQQEQYATFRSVLGQLNWLVVISRPDLSYSTNTLAQVMTNPTYGDYQKLMKAVRLTTDHANLNLEYVKLDKGTERCIVAFSDASLAHLRKEGKYHSQTGTLIFLAAKMDDHYRANLIEWSSKKQKRICRSTLSAETLAACDTLDRALAFRDTYRNVHNVTLHIHLLVDCKSLAQTALCTTSIAEKRLQADIGAIRELVEKGDVTITHIPTTENLADCLTKPMQVSSLQNVLSSHCFPNYSDC